MATKEEKPFGPLEWCVLSTLMADSSEILDTRELYGETVSHFPLIKR